MIMAGNSDPAGSDHRRMDLRPAPTCDDVRELLSARLDGEAPAWLPAEIDAHLRGCAGCRAFDRGAAAFHRAVRVRPAEPVPDLTERILAAATTGVGPAPSRTGRWPSGAQVRVVLGAVAVVQLAVAVPALVLGDGAGGSIHVAHHLGDWDVALAIGLLMAVWQPARAWGLLPMAAALVACMVGSAAIDLSSGHTVAIDEAPHLLQVLGVILLWRLARHAPAPGRVRPRLA